MTRLLVLAALCTLGLALPALAEEGVPHRNDVTVAALSAAGSGSTPLSQTALTYKYQNKWGIAETWQIQGTTVLYHKSVRTAALHDQARLKLAGGGSLSDLDSQIFDLEYGDFDRFYVGTLEAGQVRALYAALAQQNFPAAPARVGCGEKHWELLLEINGQKTQKYDVHAPGNPILAASLGVLQPLLSGVEGSLSEISQADFASQYKELAPAMLGSS